jgi:peptidoglycan/xylan/chitin deacetylase (PgdA/CDA1 family)
MVPKNCQKAFGRCDSDNIPAGGNTSSDARPLIGKISYDKRIEHCLKERTIALTFDDGPSEHTGNLLDILAEYNAKATFFIAGNNNGKGEIDTTKKWFDLIRRMIAEGHQVASHTFDHVRLSKTSSELRKIEMLKNERAIANIVGE